MGSGAGPPAFGGGVIGGQRPFSGGCERAGFEATRIVVPSHPVPRLIGDTESQARATLDQVHLNLKVGPPRYSSAPSGTVISQSLRRGRAEKRAGLVPVVLSRGPQPVEVPSNQAT